MRIFRTESALERACIRRAKKRGCISKKQSTVGPRGDVGWPDRQFFAPGGVNWFVEFKLPGEVPTKVQWRVIRKLLNLGQTVYVIDNVAAFDKTLDQHMGAPTLHGRRCTVHGKSSRRRIAA